MSTELEIASKFNKTFENYPFLFQLPKKTNSTSLSPNYVSRNFCQIAEKIDALLSAPSIHNYIRNLLEKAPTTLSQETISIDDSSIEVENVQFSLFTEQLAINFGIELCITIAELLEPKRSNHNKNERLEPVEYSIKNSENDCFEADSKEYKQASLEQGKRFYPKVWELYTDNKKLIECLRLHTYALQAAILIEPYFLQTKAFHYAYSLIPIPTSQRFNLFEQFFLNTNKLKLPIANKRIICRTLLILRTFNSNFFKPEPKMHEIIIPALMKSNILKGAYARPTLERAYFLTMRNDSAVAK